MAKAGKKMEGTSKNPQQELLELLKKQFPEVFNEGKVDCQKLKASIGEQFSDEPERFGLSWTGKSNCFREIQTPTTATLKPAREESVNFDETENIFIEGDNLEVLKILQKSYYGKVKMIYIDPPYNTGNDFIYNDDFKKKKEDYLRESGQKDEEGNLRADGLMRNTRERGHYHSDWLNMMYPRLFLARNLLRQDGVIFVSIDDNEVHNLRAIMNEIFGEENFVAQFIWEKRTTRENRRVFSFNHDLILCFARSLNEFESTRNFLPLSDAVLNRYSNPDNDPRGPWQSVSLNAQAGHATKSQFYTLETPGGKKIVPPTGRCWSVTKERMDDLIEDNRVWFGKDGSNVPRLKKFQFESEQGLTPHTLWKASEVGTNDNAKKSLIELFGGRAPFETPKPLGLIERILTLSTHSNNEDIVLDFFAGSATTAHAVIQLNAEDGGNRKCISVQLPELCEEGSEAYKSGFKTIADISKERIRRAGKKISEESEKKLDLDGTELDVGFKVFKLDESNFKIWRKNIKDEKELQKSMEDYIDNLKGKSKQEDVLYELIVKNGLDLNAKVEKKKGGESEYFKVNDGELVIFLEDEISKELVQAVLDEKPQQFVCLDRCFGGNDQLKTNTVLQMDREKIEFKVI